MRQEDRELILKDLSARQPYGVFVGYEHYTDRHIVTTKLTGIRGGLYYDADGQIPDNELKPYLRPMRSITEEEIKELSEIDMKRLIFSSRHLTWHLDGEIIDYLNKKMLDWRGLIPRGLAFEATEGMYN